MNWYDYLYNKGRPLPYKNVVHAQNNAQVCNKDSQLLFQSSYLLYCIVVCLAYGKENCKPLLLFRDTLIVQQSILSGLQILLEK